jgi:hypothetical protein
MKEEKTMPMSIGKLNVIKSILLDVTVLKDSTIYYIEAYKKKYKVDARDVIDHMVRELRELKGEKEFRKCLEKSPEGNANPVVE